MQHDRSVPEATVHDILAQIASLQELVQAQGEEIAHLRAGSSSAVLSPRSQGVAVPSPSKLGRRGWLRTMVGATVAAALLTMAKETPQAHAFVRATYNSATSSNFGLIAAVGAVAPDTLAASVVGPSSTFGVVGIHDSAGFISPDNAGVLGSSSSSSGVVGISATSVGVRGVSSNSRGVSGQTSSTSNGQLGVYGRANGTSGTTNGVCGETSSNTADAAGVLGRALTTTGAGVGVWGTTPSTATAAKGVYGEATGATGTTYGVWGKSFSTSGVGVRGEALASSGVTRGISGRVDSPDGEAVFGQNTATSGATIGVKGDVNSTSADAAAVRGTARGLTGANFGVFGSTVSGTLNASGVYGLASATTGSAIGVRGRTTSTSIDSIGVLGEVVAAGNSTAVGVKGVSNAGVGLQGTSVTSYGLAGASTTSFGLVGASSQAIGVYGRGGTVGIYGVPISPNGFAAQFNGNVVIQGSLTVTGSFPKSAAVKKRDGSQARMYCMESPESWFEDFGTAELKQGQATVDLDPEFDQVVKGDDYRVFLTEIGDCGGLFVSRKGPHRCEVRSRAGAVGKGSFDYRVVARRFDNVGKRMEKVEIPPVPKLDESIFAGTDPARPGR